MSGRGLPRITAFPVLAALVILLASACDNSDSATESSTGLTEQRFRDGVQALCEARAEADAGDRDAASRVFYDGVHGFLHELAAPVAERDREAAADLHIAKNRVETALAPGARDAGEPSLPDLFGRLTATTRAAGQTIGMNASDCA